MNERSRSKMTEHILSADENGVLSFIYSDETAFLSELGATTVTRASHVEPDGSGQWQADMNPVGGPILGPFKLRQTALDAEVDYLKENIL